MRYLRKTNDDKDSDCMFGVVVNPRDGKLYSAYRQNADHVLISDIRGWMKSRTSAVSPKDGEGYFNKDPQYEGPSIYTGLPRVHVPAGVSAKQTGLGTVLYTSLCFAAMLSYMDTLRFETHGYSGSGICSGYGRTKNAVDWWTNAKTKYGLASGEEAEIRRRESADWKDKGRESGKKYVANYAKEEWDLEVDTDEEIDIDIDAVANFTVIERGLVDVYRFETAEKYNIPVAYLYNEDSIFYTASSTTPGDWYGVNVGSLVNCNMSAFDPSKKDDVDLAFLLMSVAKHHGASSKEVDGMLERFRDGLDVEMAPDPRDPSFVESISRYDIRAAGRVIGKMTGRTLKPRRMVWAPTSASGRISGSQTEMLSNLAQNRRKLGWDVFAE